MKTKLRWGIIGCGDVVEKKSGPSIMGTGNSEIVHVMRRNLEKSKEYADANAILKATDKADEVLNNPDVDIIYIATPPNSHKDYVLQAAEAGKHILVEKPMGLNEAQSLEMCEACEKAGAQLFVAYYRRFHPHVLKMKELIAEGRLGRLLAGSIEFRDTFPGIKESGWRLQPEVGGGGHLIDNISHRIDLFVDLFGDTDEIAGSAVYSDETGAEEALSLSVRFQNGIIGTATGNVDNSLRVDRFQIIGTEAEIVSDPLDGCSFVLRSREKEELFSFDPFPAPHLGLIQHIEKVLAEKGTNGSPGRDGLITDRIWDRSIRQTS